MPEAPELEVVKDFLVENIIGVRIDDAAVLKPSVLRSLCGDITQDLPGRTFESVERRGKFILIGITGGRLLSINPMLTGALQYCAPKRRVYKRTCLTLALSNGSELRYIDDKQMGMVYYVGEEQVGEIPRLHEQGPDVLDDYTFEDFKQRLKGFHGEKKAYSPGAASYRASATPGLTRFYSQRRYTPSAGARRCPKKSCAVSTTSLGGSYPTRSHWSANASAMTST